jgi:[acyl-carrier-protein] S-malonyltransferase
MGKELHDAFPAARQVFEEVSGALSLDMAALCFSGTEEELRLTENTQPAIFTVSVAAWRVLQAETGIVPAFAAGHSLGEYSALAAAGVLPVAGAARVLRSRGRYMQEAVPVGEGAMAAVLGLPSAAVEEACRIASAAGVVSPANFNGGDQVVISGAAAAVAAAGEEAKKLGAKRVIPLSVSAPFHCALMRPAAERLLPELEALPVAPFRFPVVANVTAAPYGAGDSVPGLLAGQITAPVRWEESVSAMASSGVGTFVEVGPGKVLGALVRRIAKEARCSSFGAPADLEGVRSIL